MLGQPGVADGEDADVLAVQPPRRDAVVDARGAQAGAAKLVVRDGAVLMSAIHATRASRGRDVTDFNPVMQG
jgi:hypothetical protein